MPKPNWPVVLETYIDALVSELEGAYDEDQLDPWISYFLCETAIEFILAEDSHWSDLERPKTCLVESGEPKEASFLTAGEVFILKIRWAAVHLVVEFADWYPWSIATFGSIGYEVLTRYYEYPEFFWAVAGPNHSGPLSTILDAVNIDTDSPTEKVKALKNTIGCHHDSFLPIVRRYPKHCAAPQQTEYYVPVCLRNPAAAARFARSELYGQALGEPGAEWQFHSTGGPKHVAFEAVSRLTEWFRGPANRYSCCNPLECAAATFAPEHAKNDETSTFADLAQTIDTYSLDDFSDPAKAVFQLVDCPKDGFQSWIHTDKQDLWSPMGKQYHLQHWYNRNVAAQLAEDAPDFPGNNSFEFLKTQKVGGCHKTSHFFVAAAVAMNIPALYGYSITRDLAGGGLGGRNLTAGHETVRLPAWELAVIHGDALWGPGVSLFPAGMLFIDEHIALAGSRKWLSVLEKKGALYVSFSTEYQQIGQLFPQAAVALRTAFAEIWQSCAHANYWQKRAHFAGMFVAASRRADYRQAALDAFVLGCRPYEYSEILDKFYEEGYGVFEALSKWMSTCSNPLHGQLFPELGDPFDPGAKLFSVQPRLDEGADWASFYPGPESVWKEPSTGGALELLIEKFGLDKLKAYDYYIMMPAGKEY